MVGYILIYSGAILCPNYFLMSRNTHTHTHTVVILLCGWCGIDPPPPTHTHAPKVQQTDIVLLVCL